MSLISLAESVVNSQQHHRDPNETTKLAWHDGSAAHDAASSSKEDQVLLRKESLNENDRKSKGPPSHSEELFADFALQDQKQLRASNLTMTIASVIDETIQNTASTSPSSSPSSSPSPLEQAPNDHGKKEEEHLPRDETAAAMMRRGSDGDGAEVVGTTVGTATTFASSTNTAAMTTASSSMMKNNDVVIHQHLRGSSNQVLAGDAEEGNMDEDELGRAKKPLLEDLSDSFIMVPEQGSTSAHQELSESDLLQESKNSLYSDVVHPQDTLEVQQRRGDPSAEGGEDVDENQEDDDEEDDDDDESGYTSSEFDSSEGSSVLTSSLSSFDSRLPIGLQQQLPQNVMTDIAKAIANATQDAGGEGGGVGGSNALLLQLAGADPGAGTDDSGASLSSNEDDLANMIAETMRAHGLALGHALAERANTIDSIKWLGQHLPESVVAFLIDEIEVEEEGRMQQEEQDQQRLSQDGDQSTFLSMSGHDADAGIDTEYGAHYNVQSHGAVASNSFAYDQEYYAEDGNRHTYGSYFTSNNEVEDEENLRTSQNVDETTLLGKTDPSQHVEQASSERVQPMRRATVQYPSEAHVVDSSYPEEDDPGDDHSESGDDECGDADDDLSMNGPMHLYNNHSYTATLNDQVDSNHQQQDLYQSGSAHSNSTANHQNYTTIDDADYDGFSSTVDQRTTSMLRRHSCIGATRTGDDFNVAFETTTTSPLDNDGEASITLDENDPRDRHQRRNRRSSLQHSSQQMMVEASGEGGNPPFVRARRRSSMPMLGAGGAVGGLIVRTMDGSSSHSRAIRRDSIRSNHSFASGRQEHPMPMPGAKEYESSPGITQSDQLPSHQDQVVHDNEGVRRADQEKLNLLRQHRQLKTRDSIKKLGPGPLIDIDSIGEDDFNNSMNQEDHFIHHDNAEYTMGNSTADLGGEDEFPDAEHHEDFYFTDAIPPATRHDCALLFVDISGFTKLSNTLKVEPLSKTINSYFQMIVEEVESFGGDILKFAGDALYAEWQASTSNYIDSGDGMSLAGSSQCSLDPWHGLQFEECVLTAAACGARIVDKCTDFPVFSDGGNCGQKVAELNVHCGVGFGEVVGVHVGDTESRMEYLILGDPIEQVSEAIDVARRGEVVASPEALIILEETAELDACIMDSDTDKPQIIATKSTCFFRPKGTAHVHQDWTVTLKDQTIKPRERLAKRCDDWALDALKRLKHRMELYVHPVVVDDESGMANLFPGDRKGAVERHRSEAELRDVFTVFIMPLIKAHLTGEDEADCNVLVLLNDVMLIMTRELARFGGQMRQFIVDDKGVVLIANFGLRGSTFPNMVSQRALPFMSTVQTLLQGELEIECQMGGTYGTAYCGVVGGVARHEYAVLGPSVNLAARLMANPANKGMLVDDSVREKAEGRQFRGLPPVKAKGYANKVPIYEPLQTEKGWTNISGRFVGREAELSRLSAVANEILEGGGPTKLVVITGETGAGKTALCVQATKSITDTCALKGIPQLQLKNIFSEGDMFVPFSIARPIFSKILKHIIDADGHYQNLPTLEDSLPFSDNASQLSVDATAAFSVLAQICETADVPDEYIDIIGRLVLTRSRPDFSDDSMGSSSQAQLRAIALNLAKAFLQCTISFDLVVLALDEIANMDENSWLVLKLLYEHSHNLMIIGTCRTFTSQNMHSDDDFIEHLKETDSNNGKFVELELAPMPKRDLDALIAKSIGRPETEIDPKIAREVFIQSGGMPNLASEFINDFFMKNMNESSTEVVEKSAPDLDVGNVGELVLHRMDSLPANARTHLNLGAILGTQFDLMDVITVFEQYRSVKSDERFGHAKSVHESLEKAVNNNILEIEVGTGLSRYSGPADHPYAAHNVSYKFTHEIWRSNILRLTLDGWKRDMHSLIAQSMETVMDSEFADDYRVLTKLFAHWKESGYAEKAATLALKMGRSLENIGLTRQGLVVYREALDMWKARDNDTGIPDETIGGLSMQLLEQLRSSDIEHIIKLNVALGRCYTSILDPRESIKAFQTALNLLHKAPSSVDLDDRSIIFPVLSGLFVALRFGHNEDAAYEQGLVRIFLRETRFNDYHFSRALAMKAEMLSRHGEFEKAIETARELRQIYNVDQHSELISQAYGSDRSGQCIAQSALWYMCVDEIDEALSVCDLVLNELLPKMDPQNVETSFQMVYPIIWVLKDNGRASEGREMFERFVVQQFVSQLDERGVTSDRPLHFPIVALLDMAATHGATEQLAAYTEWALVEKNGLFGSELNFTMGSAGRTADSITAELCLRLARSSSERSEKTFLIRKGYELARDAIDITMEKEDSRGMLVAYWQVKHVFDQLEDLHRSLPPDRRSRRLSVGW